MPNFKVSEQELPRSVLMDRLYLQFHKIIPDLAMSRGQFEFATHLDQTMVGTIAQLRGWLLDGHKIQRTDSETIEFPASPWQFFKQRYMPKWFLSHWPVIMDERAIRVAVHHHYICPHVSIEKHDLGGSNLHFLWMGEMSGQLPEGSIERWQTDQREK